MVIDPGAGRVNCENMKCHPPLTPAILPSCNRWYCYCLPSKKIDKKDVLFVSPHKVETESVPL